MTEEDVIEYPNPTCERCKTKVYLMFYQGKVECSNCHEIIWMYSEVLEGRIVRNDP